MDRRRDISEYLGLEGIRLYVALVTLVALAVFPLLDLLLQAAGVTHGFTFYDFTGAFYTAGERALGADALYARVSNPYVYPPAVVLLFVPFTVVDAPVAAVLWTISSFAVLYGGIIYLLSTLDVDLDRPAQLLVLLALVGFFPTLLWLKAGQVSGLLAGSFALAAGLVERHRNGPGKPAVLAGALTAVAALVKPVYLPACAHLLRDRRRLAGGALGAATLYGASAALFGPASLRRYAEVLLIGKGWGQEAAPGGVSASITDWGPFFFRPFYVFGEAALYVHLLVAGLVAAGALLSGFRRSDRLDRHVLCLGLLTVPLASPIPDLFAVYMTIPAVVVVLVDEHRREDGLVMVPVLSVLGLHLHAYVLGFFAGFGATYVPQLRLLEPLLPFMQLGVWSILALFGLQVYRAVGAWRSAAGTVRYP